MTSSRRKTFGLRNNQTPKLWVLAMVVQLGLLFNPFKVKGQITTQRSTPKQLSNSTHIRPRCNSCSKLSCNSRFQVAQA